MGLINLRTNLKDLKFGHDELGNGNSGQPFIQTRIPATDEPLQTGVSNAGPVLASVGAGAVVGAIGGSILGSTGAGAAVGAAVGLGIGIAGANATGDALRFPSSGTGGPDFLIRGGTLLPGIIANDAIRLTKYFKNTEGILFTVKQNLLSRIAVRTQASPSLLNEGIYTPLSTLIEAAGNPFGLHVKKQGLNPFGSFLGTDTYSDVIGTEISRTNKAINRDNSEGTLRNRLVGLWDVKLMGGKRKKFGKRNDIAKDEDGILAYGGGPNSFLGIGKTRINFATDNTGAYLRTGANNILLKSGPQNAKIFLGGSISGNGSDKKTPTTQYLSKDGKLVPIDSDLEFNTLRFLFASLNYGVYPYINSSLASAVSPSLPNSTINLLNPEENNTVTYTQQDIVNIPESPANSTDPFVIGRYASSGNTNARDFRAKIKDRLGIIIPDYTKANIEQRVNLGDPGRLNKNVNDYVNGIGGKYQGAASAGSFDKLNVVPLYFDENVDLNKDVNDLVKFRIAVIDNNTPSKKTYIHFRAFLDNISDQYLSNWDATKYIGRGENFYTYSGFDRKVSLSWTVAAQSKVELIPMYKKLNYLASICTPDYSGEGYMRGNIVELTVGGYFYNQPGIITGFTYEMNNENETWEIGINNDDKASSDSSVKELPHLIRVKGFSFTPIHTFAPRKQKLTFDNTTKEATVYGPQRYIALSNGEGNNYGSDAVSSNTSNQQSSNSNTNANTNNVINVSSNTNNNTNTANEVSSNSNTGFTNQLGLQSGESFNQSFNSDFNIENRITGRANEKPQGVSPNAPIKIDNGNPQVENVSGLGTVDLNGVDTGVEEMLKQEAATEARKKLSQWVSFTLGQVGAR